MSDLSLGQNETSGPEEKSDSQALRRFLARYFILFKRYAWVILLAITLCVVAAYFFTQRRQPLYRATAKIMFHQSNPNLFGKAIDRLELVDPGGRWQFEQFWFTQKEVFQSRWFIENLIEREALMDNAVFASGLPSDPDDAKRIATDRVRRMLDASLQPGSRVAVIKVEGHDPKLTKTLADGIAHTYVRYTRDLQKGGINSMSEWFESQVKTTRNQLDEAQTARRAFEKDNKILTLSYEKQQALTATDIESTTRQLNDVLDRLDAEESLMNQIREMEKKDVDKKTIAQLVNSPNLSQSIQGEDSLEQELADLESLYGPDYEKVKGVRDQLKVVRENIDDEIGRIKSGVENRVGKLRREKRRKEKRISDLKLQADELDALGQRYYSIKEKAETTRSFYDVILNRSKELDINSNFESKPIEVLQESDLPRKPVSPSMPLNLMLGFLLGLFFGLSIVLIVDALDNTVKSESDVDRVTRKPILGHLPQIDANLLKQFGSIDTMVEIAPKSSFAEGIRTLRTNLMFMSPDNPPRLLLVTSPGPGEGKTLISTNMAIAMAKSGLSTLIVDSDMRRPRVHKALAIQNEKGLSNVLSGDVASPQEVVNKTEIENLFVMTCGEIPPNPSELLHTERFHEVVAELGETFDRVIFDSPPLAAVADGLVLSHSVDGVLLILKFGQTRRELLKRSIEQLEAIGAPFMGCVLNDISADVGSAYAYSYYYYRYRYDEDGPKKKRLAS